MRLLQYKVPCLLQTACLAQEMQQRAKLGALHSVSLLSGGRNGLMPAQYKTHDRLIAQASLVAAVHWNGNQCVCSERVSYEVTCVHLYGYILLITDVS